MNREKLAKMAGSVRTGGKGSVRRWVASNRSGITIPFQQQDKLDENNSSDGNEWQPASMLAPYTAAA
jgi:hypothetical protein